MSVYRAEFKVGKLVSTALDKRFDIVETFVAEMLQDVAIRRRNRD